MKYSLPFVAAIIGVVALLIGVVTSSAASPATLTVNSTGDEFARDGVLTLREAMELAGERDALQLADLDDGECAQVSGSTYGPPCSSSDTTGMSSADTIIFDPLVFPPEAPATIALGSALPDLYSVGDTVDGSGAGVIVDGVTKTLRCFAVEVGWGHVIRGLQIYNCHTGIDIVGENGNRVTVEGNVISGNITGMNISGAFNLIKGNLIGTDPTGSFAVPNSRGIYMSGYQAIRNVIVGNVISGNHGDGIGDCWDFEQVIQGNLIGTDITGTRPIPNGGHGIHFLSCGGSRTIVGGVNAGEGNVIAFNGGDGVRQANSDANPVTIRGNSIRSNGGKGIENLGGGNLELPPPVITAVAPPTGTACANCVIDVYSDDEDEGRVYEGSTSADGGGEWSFGGAVSGPNVTATATDAIGNTSEFSSPVFPVGIDIVPYSARNLVSGRHGLIPVTVLSSASFAARSEVDRTSLTFGRTGGEASLALCLRIGFDVNRDGLRDLTCFFRATPAGFHCGDTEGFLRGRTVDGVPIGGRDSVRVVRC